MIRKFFGIIFSMALPLFWLAGIAIHLWTIIIAFFESGFIAAGISLCFPVISQIYWLFSISSKIGWVNSYSMAICLYVVLFIVGIIGTMLLSKDETSSSY